LRTSEVCAGSEHFRRIARASSMRTLTSNFERRIHIQSTADCGMRFASSSLRLGALSPHRPAHGKRSSEATDNCVRTAGRRSTDLLVLFSR
jgi:hypothetical protein